MLRVESGKGELSDEKVREILCRNGKAAGGITISAKRIRDYFAFLRLKIVATCLNDVYNGSNRRLCYGTKRQTDPAFKVKA